MAFTGVRDLDIKIMNDLSDEDLHHFCQTNVQINNICNDDKFWQRRLYQRFGPVPLGDYNSWKELYIYYMINQKYGKYLGTVKTIAIEKPSLVTPGEYYDWLNKYFKLIDLLYQIPDDYEDIFDMIRGKVMNYPSLYFALIAYKKGYISLHYTDLQKVDKYFEIPSGNFVNTADREGVKDYIFQYNYAVSGYSDDIRNYLLRLGYDIENINMRINESINNKPPSKIFNIPNKLPNINLDGLILKLTKDVEDQIKVNNKVDEIMVLINGAANDLGNRFIDALKSKLRRY